MCMFSGVFYFWADAFMHDVNHCHSNSDCVNRDIVWVDGSDVGYNASLYHLRMIDNNEHCTYMIPVFDPRTGSQLTGTACHHTMRTLCSAPCDEKSEYHI